MNIKIKQKLARYWFTVMQDIICLEIENLDVQVDNVEAKLKDLAKRRADATPSEIMGMEKE